MSPPSDHSEVQARGFASSEAWGPPAAAGAGVLVRPSHVRAVRAAIAGPARPLDTPVRSRFEPELGLDLGAVRIHTDSVAATSATDLRAKAYAIGSHLVFAPGGYQPDTPGGQRLIAHELAHVAQQSALRTPALAADVDVWDVIGIASPVGAQVGRSLHLSGMDLLEAVGKAAMGETMWKVLRSFVHGFEDGLRNAPAAQMRQLKEKWGSFGVSDADDFTEGYIKGVFVGLWNGLVGLVETVVDLVKLPVQVVRFLEGLPEMASRYGQRIAELIQRGGALVDKFASELKADPAGTVARLRQLAEGAGDAVLKLVEGAGRGAAAEVLGFLNQAWDKIGEDIGKLVGRVLFEVLLAVATDLIGNAVKEAVRVIGALFAKGIEAAAEIVRLIRGLIGRALAWIEGLAGRITGRLGSLLEELKVLVADFGRLFAQMEPEFAGAPGLRASALDETRAGARTTTSTVPKGGGGTGAARKPSFATDELREPTKLPAEPVLSEKGAALEDRVKFLEKKRDRLGPIQRKKLDDLRGRLAKMKPKERAAAAKELEAWESTVDRTLREEFARELSQHVPFPIEEVGRIPTSEGGEWEQLMRNLNSGKTEKLSITSKTRSGARVQIDEWDASRRVPREHKLSKDITFSGRGDAAREARIHELRDQMERHAEFARDWKLTYFEWDVDPDAVTDLVDSAYNLLTREQRAKIRIVSGISH
jgi:Domain of unknown function (DUF4157)